MVVGDILPIKIVLNHNPNRYTAQGAPASYDGYLLSLMDVGVAINGSGTIVPTNLIKFGPNKGEPLVGRNAGFGHFQIVDEGSQAPGEWKFFNGIDRVAGVSLAEIQGKADLVWDLAFRLEGTGYVIIDLTLTGLNQYKSDAFVGDCSMKTGTYWHVLYPNRP